MKHFTLCFVFLQLLVLTWFWAFHWWRWLVTIDPGFRGGICTNRYRACYKGQRYQKHIKTIPLILGS